MDFAFLRALASLREKESGSAYFLLWVIVPGKGKDVWVCHLEVLRCRATSKDEYPDRENTATLTMPHLPVRTPTAFDNEPAKKSQPMIQPPVTAKNNKTVLKIFGVIGVVAGFALLVFVQPNPTSEATTTNLPQPSIAANNLPSQALGLPAAPTSSPADRDEPALVLSNDDAQQRSFGSALSAARHEVEPITEADGALEQNHDVHLFAQNPGNQFTARFLDESVRLGSGRSDSTWQTEVSVPGLPPVREIAYQGGRVEYDRGTIIEWYDNLPQGLQQGFIVREPTSGDGIVRVEVAMDGLAPQAAGDNRVHLLNEFGQPILSYSELLAWDATGRELPASMEVLADGVALVVSAQGAAYPITIDPVFATLQEKVGSAVIGDGVPSAYLGWSVAISGTTAVMGAPGDDTPLGTDSGSAYVFQLEKGAWLRQAKLLSNDGEANDFFGYAVGISGDTIVVGTPNDDTTMGSDSGSAQVFIRAPKSTSWTPTTKLQPSDAAMEDQFGTSVAIEKQTILIGSKLADTAGGLNAGAAYVFIRGKDPASAWSQEAKLMATDGAMNDFFGSSLAFAKNMALIGSPADDTMAGGADAGSAYVFIRSGTSWTQQTKLEREAAASSENFGTAVSLFKDTAVIGVPGYDGAATNQGCAIVFKQTKGQWIQAAQLARTTASEDDFMGQSVAISGSIIGVGAPGVPSGSIYPNKGAVYTYVLNRGLWAPQSTLQPGSASPQANSGFAVAMDRNVLLVGAPYNNTTAGTEAGSAYVYRFNRKSGWWDNFLSAGHTNAGGETGTSVAIFQNTIVAGAPLDDTPGGTDAGRAFILTRVKGKWFLELALRSNPGSMSDQFGHSVAVSKDHVIVGVPGEDTATKTNTGGVVTFTRTKTGWSNTGEFSRQDAEDNDAFGTSVAISGNTAIVGAPHADPDAKTSAGTAYILTFVKQFNTWQVQAKLTAEDAAASDFFGTSVSLSKKLALVGAPGDDNVGGSEAGSAYVFQNSGATWLQQAQLFAADAAADDRFGSAVSLFGYMALVGAPFDDTSAGTNAGSAYLFTRQGKTWLQTEQFIAEDGAANDTFGSSVALERKTALVGAPTDDTMSGGTNAGSAYNFGPASGSKDWVQLQQFTDPSGADNDRFGYSVGVSANTAVIGAPYDDTFSGSNSGSLLIFVP